MWAEQTENQAAFSVYWREPLLRARSRGSLCARRISRWPPALL